MPRIVPSRSPLAIIAASACPSRLAHGSDLYEIVAPVASGGMGEIYRARDSRLDRTVAIKTLPTDLAFNPERLERFEREARAVAGLSHPNICTLFDVGHQNGIDFLVMEYLEGETLAERLASRGALPVDQVLRYAIEITEALDRAHRSGIVHRDLKPANIMLTATGAKLLDFGVAKSRPETAPIDMPTEATRQPLTAEGSLIGTLQYMAPEQLEGREADSRTDLFALGAIIYEMATGRRAFTGRTQASVIAAILSTEPPPMSSIQPLAPPQLERLVRVCLAKDPYDRWQSARDLLRELKWIGGDISEPRRQVGILTSARFIRGGAILAVLAAAGLGGAAAWRALRTKPIPARVTQTVLTLQPAQSLVTLDTPAAVISPDGSRIVFVGEASDTTQRLYLRDLSRPTADPIPETDGAYNPFFSPDGQWLAFFADGKLKKVSLSGGAARVVCDAPTADRGAAWTPAGTIVFPPSYYTGLSRVAADGGTPQTLTTPDRSRDEKSHRLPEALPDGRAVLMTIGSADISSFDDAHVDLLEMESGSRRTIIEGGASARYAPTGHLVYARAGSLLAVPFDLNNAHGHRPAGVRARRCRDLTHRRQCRVFIFERWHARLRARQFREQ